MRTTLIAGGLMLVATSPLFVAGAVGPDPARSSVEATVGGHVRTAYIDTRSRTVTYSALLLSAHAVLFEMDGTPMSKTCVTAPGRAKVCANPTDLTQDQRLLWDNTLGAKLD